MPALLGLKASYVVSVRHLVGLGENAAGDDVLAKRSAKKPSISA